MNLDLELQEKRHEIALIDQQIAKLCQKRLFLTEEVFLLKRAHSCPVVDAAQEAKVLENYLQMLKGATSFDKIKAFVNSLINLSKSYSYKSKELS